MWRKHYVISVIIDITTGYVSGKPLSQFLDYMRFTLKMELIVSAETRGRKNFKVLICPNSCYESTFSSSFIPFSLEAASHHYSFPSPPSYFSF
jgi:hypothetical protein